MAEHAWGCSCPNADAPCLDLEQHEEPTVQEPHAIIREASGPFNFGQLPGELRLRVLCYTHLGPASTGDYHAWHEELLIRDGKLDQDNFNPVNGSTSPCLFKSTHYSPAPCCNCRILPMALFLVNRQMHAEAVEVFWPNASFTFYTENFSNSLAALRRLPLRHLTHLQFTMSPAQADGWGLGARACGFPEAEYRRLGLHGGGGGGDDGGGARPDHQAEWAAMVAFLAEQTELLSRLRIVVNFASCGWALADEGELLTVDEVDFGWFRFLYEFVVGVATALCRLKTLRGVKFALFPFANLEPWLEREVMGCRDGYGELEAPSRRGFGNHIPSWHDLGKRLEGSNYHPS